MNEEYAFKVKNVKGAMKKNFLFIIRMNRGTLVSYKDERSDMGCMVYYFTINVMGKVIDIVASYYIGEENAKEACISMFLKDLQVHSRLYVEDDRAKFKNV